MPFGLTEIESFLNATLSFSIVSGDSALSTYTIALFKSPPFIKPCSNNISISCKKLNVRESEISFLKSEI